ncbi:hypothetical protein V0R50_25670 [Pseudomonas sp. 148P]|uniref:Uncharacterized protein n=1 Tax=Pseudomonas ulcerans TaxID=3115852 RepID=A0ABU7HYQ6_9PSED|nr:MULTISPECIES: hypothetical protein [unclassified Pseudomonas]MEE1925218.1 hypothetical protein [Pseudomonas sp. 147P]MEE1936626.1 hypothetical protein [Pseudomonas sp. 148P]
MDISKGIPLASTPRSIADLNLAPVKPNASFAHDLKAATEALRKAEAVERGIGRLESDNAPHNALNVVMKGDQLVATIYKSGAVAFTDQYAAQLKNLNLSGDSSSQPGSVRAAMMAKAVGGEVLEVNRSSPAS